MKMKKTNLTYIRMKRLFLSFLTLLTMGLSAQNVEQPAESADTLSQEQKELVFTFAEQFILNAVDSVMQEGMYMQALEILDSMQVNWEKVTGKAPSAQMYMRKGQIYMILEEWQQLVEVTKECIYYNREIMPDRISALIYSMQGSGYRNLEQYKDAIRSYEHAVSFYTKAEDLGSQGDMLCSIAYSYDKIGKSSAASSFYEKGLTKFLQYFNTTKKSLLQSDLKVTDLYMQSVMGVFGAHLFNMAIHKQDLGDRVASKEYLLMSAHSGNTTARSEYNRIYGN